MARIPIALQLYSVRDDCARDLEGTLAAIAAMGYEGVEFAGFYDRPAKEVRRLLDDNGLQVAGSHTGLHLLQGDKLQETIEYNLELGNKYMVIPAVPQKMRDTKAACLETAGIIQEIAEALKPHGMYTGYHNHKDEVMPLPDAPDESAFTVLFDATGDDVVVQIDVGHAMRGGADPVALIERYPGRLKTVHVKEFDPNDETTAVGQGAVPWEKVFAACESKGGPEWYIVEHERYTLTPMESVELCLKNLKAMGK